jgi:SAM-dependent methyltransferase
MANIFDSPHMAAGYAAARPPVHQHVVDRIVKVLGLTGPVGRALDVGCGAGLSTAALQAHARERVGIDPSRQMLRLARSVADGAAFVNAAAERIAVAARSIDLMTAAGSLNWVDLSAFWPEVRRVLAVDGRLVVYDFSPGRAFRDADTLSRWFARFQARYPSPPARGIEPRTLLDDAAGLRLAAQEPFEIGLTLSPEFYLRYVLTETNVAAAIGAGASRAEVEGWCRETLTEIFDRPREILFLGYLAVVTVDAS